MNILILSWRGPGHPHAGGAETVTHEHAKAWVKAGHEVTLFTSYYAHAKEKEYLDDVLIFRRGKDVFGVQFAAYIWYLLGKHKKFDLVIDQFHGIPFFTPIYVRVRKLAFIHEVAKEVWKLNPWPKPLNLIPAHLGIVLEPLIFKFFYKDVQFMTVSESTRDDLVAWGIPKKNIMIIHNGINLSALAKNSPKNKEARKTAIYLGALSEDKGVFDAVNAFAQVIRKDDEWQFWIAGKSSDEIDKRLKALIKNLNIKDKVKFFGFVTDKKKFELLSRAHVLINPSVREGWGLVNIEANAAGTPVIGYNVPGMKDSVVNQKTGLLVNPGDYKSIAESTLKLIGNQQMYKTYVANSRKWASKFSWHKSTQESLELIESL